MTILSFRDEFHLPVDKHGNEVVYLCGNSLGLQPKGCREAVSLELDKWARHAVEGHFEQPYPWYTYHEYVRDSLARLMGAKPEEVVAMNSLTTNLHLLMVSFYQPTPTRHKIMIEGSTFPSDRYAVQSQLAFHGYDPQHDLIELMPDTGDLFTTEYCLEAIEKHGSETALLLFSGVHYLTGQLFDMEKICQHAHQYGIMVGFDLAHAAGNVLLNLHDWQVDFAAWCSYKYLNAGPGGIAGIFVHERHCLDAEIKRFTGWWGNDSQQRFDMRHAFEPVPTADSWQLSNPPILQLAALRASLAIFDKVDLKKLRQRGDELTTQMQTLLEQHCGEWVQIITPKELSRRGNQLSLKIKGDAKQVHRQLQAHSVICDFRQPDVLRIAAAPLYNNQQDIERFVATLSLTTCKD